MELKNCSTSKTINFGPTIYPQPAPAAKITNILQVPFDREWFDKPIEEEEKQIIELRRSHIPDGVVDALQQIKFPAVEEDCDISDTVSKAIDRSVLFTTRTAVLPIFSKRRNLSRKQNG